jgi:hypothetical protein
MELGMEARNRPSIFWGLAFTLRNWGLVLSVWLVGMVLLAPPLMILGRGAVTVFGMVPEGCDLPAGDGLLLISKVFRESRGTVGVGLVLALFGSWVWTVLWHGGVARASVWDARGPRAGVSHILGLGVGAWWRYSRLSLVALAMFSALLAIVWIPLGVGIDAAYRAMAEDRMVLLIGIGIVLSPIVKLVVWGATLRGAWELARPDVRSPVAAWFRGLMGVFRRPISTLGPLLVLGLLQAVMAIVPLVAPFFVPTLRGTPLGSAVAAAATLASSFFLVALFAAFAPVSGLVFRSGDDEA